MKNKKLRIANYAIPLLALLALALLYRRLPQQVPLSWGFSGDVSYGSKMELFMSFGLGVVLALLFDALPHIDPRKANYEKFGSYYDLFCVFMQIFLLIVNAIILVESFLPGTLSVPMIILILVGILFLFFGNIMPKVKSNFFMGFKTPWALSSEENWRRTQRLGGKCLFIAGLLTILLAFLPNQELAFILLMAVLIVACLIPVLMS
ncbi:MAG: SdpI family protein, partial [Lachnospiraceae bacterium]|nr:SdpI family protein [Lachnospiraceae bacterium]